MVYSINLDFEQVSLNELMKVFNKKKYDLCLYNNTIFIHSSDDQVSVSNVIKKITSNFLIKTITQADGVISEDFGSNWCYERLQIDLENEFNIQRQEELQKMSKNIQDIKLLLEVQQSLNEQKTEENNKQIIKEG